MRLKTQPPPRYEVLMMKQFSFLAVAILTLSTFAAHAVDMNEVERQLKGDGVQGWIHAAVADQGIYVFTYRTPGHFFDYAELSLVPSTSTVAKALPTFTRHDLVKIKGIFLKTPS